MFDTTIYTFKDKDYLKKINDTCYKHLFKNNTELNEDPTIQNLMEYQERKIIEAITQNRTCTNIIFIGHHPIITKVYKKITNKDNTTEYKNISDFNSKMITFFNSMPESLNKKTIYYLCADTHFYQKSDVIINNKLKIHQYIVGTGGADQDKLPIFDKNITELYEEHKTLNDIPISYNIIEHKRTFGFITVDIQRDDTISIEYHDTETKTDESKSEDLSGGYLKKYLKYKAKYLQLKQNL